MGLRRRAIAGVVGASGGGATLWDPSQQNSTLWWWADPDNPANTVYTGSYTNRPKSIYNLATGPKAYTTFISGYTPTNTGSGTYGPPYLASSGTANGCPFVVNGHRLWSFQGIQELYTGAYPTGINAMSVAYIGALASASHTNGRYLSGNVSGGNNDYSAAGTMNSARSATNSSVAFGGSGHGTAAQGVTYGVPFILVGIVTPTTVQMFLNGNVGTALTGLTNTLGFTKTSLGYSSYATGENLTGSIGILLIDTQAWNVSTRQKVEGWYAAIYAMQSVLPAGHPYKSTAPTVEYDNDNFEQSEGGVYMPKWRMAA